MDETQQTALLREIRDQQRDQMTLYQRQLDRVERINDRVEAIHARAGWSLRLVMLVAFPVLILLTAQLPWFLQHPVFA
jgi:ABC-type uncharacterized transport system involved in gliding motility auxiliary subunit